MPAASHPRGAYRKSSARREQIVDAALDVFARDGYLHASATEIARMAGLTLPGLSHHYPTKAALFEAVVDRRDLDAQSRLEERHGIDLLRGLVAIAERDQADPRGTRLLSIMSIEASDPDHPLHGYFLRRYHLIIDNVARALEEVQRDGLLRRGLSPVDAARRYAALSDGLQIQAMYDPVGTPQSEMLRRALEDMLTQNL